MARKNRYTIYDMMEDKGVFEQNPANTSSVKYQGPVPYPRMLYHPMGQERVTQKAEIIVTPLGPERVGEQRELLSKVVNSLEEEEAARAEGWHDHPAKAMAAAGKEAPAVGPIGEAEELRKKIRELEARVAKAEAPMPLPVQSKKLPSNVSAD